MESSGESVTRGVALFVRTILRKGGTDERCARRIVMKRTALSFGVALLWAAGCMGEVPTGSEKPVEQENAATAQQALSGAVFTTFDVDVQGCLNGTNPNGINCNLYSSKQSVYTSGGPLASGLEDGTYFFAVLTPGAQNGGYLDGAAGNLSDTTANGSGDDGSGDLVGNRTFTVTDHAISAYGGSHATGHDPQGGFVIGLFPFDDTDNPGGEYILAVCEEGATSDSQCKFDAFKVKAGGCESAADCDDGNPCTDDVCDAGGACSHPAGNAGAVCRPSAGACDAAEVCSGDSNECPADGKSVAVCRPAAGPCDAPESCDGASNDCPADGFLPASTECRSAAGACDVAESCTGASAECPSDTKSTAVCRASAGACDVAESCDGASNDCPADGFLPASTECRSAAGACDVAESCTGASAECPSDTKSTAECRASAGVCDAPESCDGVSNDCPADAFLPASTECRASAGACDLSESCTGASAECPADAKSTAECRASAGVCDVAESCDGVGNDCPADAFLPATTECRGAAGVCDVAESCTGASAECPSDAKSTAECRASAGECDVAESCDGVGNDCPADAVKPVNTACSDDGSACTADVCDGSGVSCQHPAQVHGHKYYDANLDGSGSGESGVAGWQILVNGVAVTSTDASGAYSYFPGFGYSGDITVCEGSSSGWVSTSDTCHVVDIANACSVDFSNVCLGAGGGLTLGFWSNKNGQALITEAHLAALRALNLRDDMGGNYDPATKLSLRTWLLNGTAVNMAYMLSVQLAAMDLNVLNGFVYGDALIFAPGTNSANALGFATVSAIIAEADASLAANGQTLDGDPARADQEALKNALDNANNNKNFFQSDSAKCAAPSFP
jgi:hypothetical protein